MSGDDADQSCIGANGRLPRKRPVVLSVLLVSGTIAAGLALRLVPSGLPVAVVKYGGSMLWASMIYWIVSSVRPRWPPGQAATISGVIAFGVEFFKLYHAPPLDAFRLTLAGKLLLGRFFSGWDLIAYVCAMAMTALVDRAIRLNI